MKSLVRLYRQQFRTTAAVMFQYRANLLIWMMGQVLEPLVYLIVWSVVSVGSGGSVGGYTPQAFAAYYIILMLVNQATYTWIMYEFEYRIRQGQLSFALLKPVHPIHADIADNVSSKLITLPIMLAVAGLLALFFHPVLHPQAWALVLFLPVLFLAFLLRFLLEWTLALAVFWTTRVSAVNQVYFFVMLFLSGQIAPIALLPHAVQIAANILPFSWMISFPVQLMLGQLTPGRALVGLGVQAVWVGIGFILMRLVWRSGVRVYSAVGS